MTNNQKYGIISTQTKDRFKSIKPKGNKVMSKKITKVQKYDMLLALGDVQADEMLVEFIKAEKDLLIKKNARPNAKVNKEKEANKSLVADNLDPDTLYSVSDVIKAVPEFDGWSTQKVSPICKALVDDGILEKVEDKKKTLYRLAKVGA